MKKIILFTSFLIGGSIIASDLHYTERSKSLKRFSWNNAGPVGQVSIIIDKSDYELNVYDEKGWYATYPVVFGNNSLADKRMEGDKNTPEGSFKILNKRVHDKWCRFLSIDYPNEESRQKFNQRKQRGEIPANARFDNKEIHRPATVRQSPLPFPPFAQGSFANRSDARSHSISALA